MIEKLVIPILQSIFIFLLSFLVSLIIFRMVFPRELTFTKAECQEIAEDVLEELHDD